MEHSVFQRVADLIFALVVDPVFKALAVGHIEFVAAERPRDEDNVTRLRVEREILDV